jgi:DMSO/TMAO reductase YedYZ molybdopterin-dependent catalytic subunit
MTNKLPPNQQLAAADKWPLVGEPEAAASGGTEPWRVKVHGMVEVSLEWSLDDLYALPQVERVIDIHCVTRWSKPGATFTGVPLKALLDQCKPLTEAKYLSFIARSDRGHSTSLPLADVLELDVLVALQYEGQPLPKEHGGPVRTIVPNRYFYKSLKWLEAIEVMAEDRLGYWEKEAGYHNEADPWKEQRYIVPNINHGEHRQLIEKRNFSGLDLLGLRAEDRDLANLEARNAQLRDAHFERCNLERACFDGANLSNAHLDYANLKSASFQSHDGQIADCEGADFRGADLRGANFTSASLFGATFTPEIADDANQDSSIIDSSTIIEPRAIAQLTPIQQAFVEKALAT